MSIVFARQQATVHQICEQLDDAPTPMAVRRLLAILMEKGHLNRQKQGREHVYLAKQSKVRAGGNALRQVLETFFDGSIGSALATHLERPGTRLTDDDIERLGKLIDDLRKEGIRND
jgi:BlaI family transcriptional regulator, penicillinase repressor